MCSNDLINYSIMQGGKSVHLPPINKLPNNTKIVLPPIGDLGKLEKLTETNLLLLNHNTKPDYYTFVKLLPPNSVKDEVEDHSAIAALVAAASSSETIKYSESKYPDTSRTTDFQALTPVETPKNLHVPLASPGSTPVTSVAKSPSSEKRRQRLGPSCDSCRSRKVKCNAEITILANTNINDFSLSSQENESLLAGDLIKVDNFNLIISNDKLIKFISCKSCTNKEIDCKFSKGFTKEDILQNKKSLKFKNVPKIGKNDLTRKSSCFNCRKRKIKCSINEELGKCDSCFKRNSQCNFNV